MCKHIFANVIFCIILLNVQSIKIRGRTSSLTSIEKTKSFPENAVIKIEPSEKSISLCKGDDCEKLEDFETKKKREEQKEKSTTNMNFLKEKIEEEKMKNAELVKKEEANKQELKNQLEERLEKIENLIANAKDKLKENSIVESTENKQEQKSIQEELSEIQNGSVPPEENVDEVSQVPLSSEDIVEEEKDDSISQDKNQPEKSEDTTPVQDTSSEEPKTENVQEPITTSEAPKEEDKQVENTPAQPSQN